MTCTLYICHLLAYFLVCKNFQSFVVIHDIPNSRQTHNQLSYQGFLKHMYKANKARGCNNEEDVRMSDWNSSVEAWSMTLTQKPVSPLLLILLLNGISHTQPRSFRMSRPVTCARAILRGFMTMVRSWHSVSDGTWLSYGLSGLDLHNVFADLNIRAPGCVTPVGSSK